MLVWKRIFLILVVLAALPMFPVQLVLYASGADIVVSATPLVTEGVLNFRMIYIGTTRIDFSWTRGTDIEYVMIRGKYEEYPENIPNQDTEPFDGYLVYYGGGSAASDTSVNFEENPEAVYYRVWGQRYDGTWEMFTYQDYWESDIVTILTASVVFIGLAVVLSLVGYTKKAWWLSFAGGFLWAGIGFWWLNEGLDSLYGFGGDYADIFYYMAFFLAIVTWATIISYWNKVEIINKGPDGTTWKTYGNVPNYNLPSSYESYKKELSRRLRG